VAADTSAFNHPALNRYVIHAAAFQSQAARAPVVLINYGGPSAVVFPNGDRVQVFNRGEAGFFHVSYGGVVKSYPFVWKDELPRT
jgi:hypothetical protein